jgi:hypothetical protein
MAEPGKIETFRENPVPWAQRFYKDADDHNRSLEPLVKKYWDFYYGKDESLERRKADEKVIRAAFFINEAKPALQTVSASIIAALDSEEEPIKVKAKADVGGDDDQFREVQRKVNIWARTSGFLTAGFNGIQTAAYMQPLTSLKLSWIKEEGPFYRERRGIKKIEPYMRGVMEWLGQPFEIQTVEDYGVINEGAVPRYLNFDELLYDPSSVVAGEGKGLIHRAYLTWDEIEADAKRLGYDRAAMQRLRDKGPYNPDATGGYDPEEGGARQDERYHADRWLICEFWIPYVTPIGRNCVQIFVLGNNDIPMFKDKLGRRSLLGRMKYPFSIYRIDPRSNEPEGTPFMADIIELGQGLNDCFNYFCDSVNAGIAGHHTMDKTEDDPSLGSEYPGVKWMLKHPEKYGYHQHNLGDAKVLPMMMDMLSAKMRQIVNASDTNQGIPGNPDETATKSMERAQGAATRSRGLFGGAGNFISNVAQQDIYMNVANGDASYLVDGEIDVPGLTGIHPADMERKIIAGYADRAQKDPVYAGPGGVMYLRFLDKMLLEKYGFAKVIPDILPSEEDVQVTNPESIDVQHQAKILKMMKDQKKEMGKAQPQSVETGAHQQVSV